MTRTTALALTVLTGFTGLVYQVTWQKYLATLLGSHSEATAAVLGIFLGGLSIGYSLFGAVTSRLVDRASAQGTAPRLLLTYGVIEAIIGCYAFAFPWLFRAAQAVSFVLPHATPALGFFFDVILAALLIGPPAVMMGATIPVLTQGLSRNLEDATRVHALVYGINTLGAFAGALAAGFYVIPRLGLDGALFAMGAINLLAGLIYALLGLRDPMTEPVQSHATESDASTVDPGEVAAVWMYLVAALLIGFAMMTLETTLIRLAGLAFGSSQFTFSMVVAAFVLCIAIGGLSVSGLSRVPRIFLAINLWVLVALLVGLYDVLPQAPYWVFVLRTAFTNPDIAFYVYHLAGFLLLLAVIGVPVVLSGITLPLIFHHLRNEVGELGSLAGRLYSWNTVGSLLGALIGGYALFFWFDLHHVYRFAIAAIVVSATLMTVRLFRLHVAVTAIAVPVLFALSSMQPWNSMILQAGLYRAETQPLDLYEGYDNYLEKYVTPQANNLLTYEDDPTASVSVREYFQNGFSTRSIVVNGKSDGNTFTDFDTMALLGILPALMADSVERTFIIGFGTGVTAGELALIDGTKSIVAAEISSGVIKAAELFAPYNNHALSRDNVEIVRSDAYRALTRSENDFNIIVSEPSNPWVTGVEMLYSREFLSLARDRLAPGGVYAQWFHKYETDNASLELVLRTYSAVFEHVSVWEAGPMDLVILGFKDIGPAVDYHRIIARTERPDFKHVLARTGITNPAELFAKEFLPVGAWHAAEFEGPTHSLYKPTLSDVAGRAFFRRGAARLPFTGFGNPATLGTKNSMLRRYIDYRGGKLDDDERLGAVRMACRQSRGFGVTMVAQWMSEAPTSQAYQEALASAVDWIARTKPEVEDPLELIEQLSALFETNIEFSDTTPN
ncbi:MAG: spermidine synthase, partial [Myxococcota bacterium]